MTAMWDSKPLGELLQKMETVNPLQSPDEEFCYIDVSSVSNKTFQIDETQKLLGKDAPSRARRLVNANDVLFATIRPTLQRIAIVPEELDRQVCSTGYFVMKPKRELDHRFLFYFLFTETFMDQMEALQKGASYPAVTDSEVRAQIISFPPLPEQQRIVGILDEAFDGIATAKANAEKNLQNARALFESHLQAVFTQRGEGWVETQIEDVCTKITDGEHLRPKMTSSGVPFLSAKDVLDNELVFTDSLFVSGDDAVKFRKRCNPEKGDILIVSRGATVGRACIVNTSRVFCLLGSVILLKVKVDFSPKFIAYALKSPEIKNQLMTVSEAAAQQAIYLRDIKPVKIGCPSLEEQSEIVSQLDSLYAETQRLESIYQQKLAALDALKKSLLDQAFRGELVTN